MIEHGIAAMAEVDTTTLAELATQRQAESIFATLLGQDTFINCTYVRAPVQSGRLQS